MLMLLVLSGLLSFLGCAALLRAGQESSRRYWELTHVPQRFHVGHVPRLGGAAMLMACLGGWVWMVLSEPVFHVVNSIGFAHMLPVSLALFAKLAPRAINATVIGLYYLAFFAANSLVGWIGGLYDSWPTTSFWLLHAAFAGGSGVVFLLFKLFLADRLIDHSSQLAQA